jgi:hypothetical protein
MEDQDIRQLLKDEPTQINQSPADITPPDDKGDLNLDEDRLSGYFRNTLKNDIMDRDQTLWKEKRKYDLKAYNGLKDAYLSGYPWPNSCFDDKTEVLTDRGWRYFEKLDLSYKVYSVNPDTQVSEYMPINALQKFEPPIKKILRFYGKSVDLCITPNHNLFLFNNLEKRYEFRHAEDFLSVNGGAYKIPLTSKWVGENKRKIYGFESEDWISFLGWYISEGWTYKSGTIGIAQSPTANPEKCFEIECLLARMGVTYSKTKDGNQYLVHIREWPIEAREELQSLGLCNQKFIPKQYLQLSEYYLKILLNSLIRGDGNTRLPREGSFSKLPHYSYATTSKRLSDDIQELCQKIGMRGTIVEDDENEGGFIRGRKIVTGLKLYRISINRKEMSKVKFLKREILDYDGFVYCATTPYHTLYVRRNGKASWCGNSNFPEPITPVILDTGQSAIMSSAFPSLSKTINGTGVGEEDNKNAKKVVNIMNWTVSNDTEDFYIEMDGNVHQMLKHGTSIFKLIADFEGGFKVCPYTIPIERFLMPIDAKSPKIKDSDHCHQLVPWTANDLLYKKSMGVYKNLEYVNKGFSIAGNISEQEMNNIRQNITGLDVAKKIERDTYFICESYVTYYEKNSLKAQEIIVWWIPGTGKIMRVRPNEDMIRPFSSYYIYPNYGYAYHKSLPEILRNIQDKADYTEKQVTDAADLAISPPGFYEEGTNFNPNESLRVPSGMYPMKNAASINWAQTNVNAIMERGRHVDQLWLKAERVSGFTDLDQGLSVRDNTATTDLLRQKRADRRFSRSLMLVNRSWKETCDQLYLYIDKYMPRDQKVKILGTNTFSTIDQIFKPKDPKAIVSPYGLQLGGKFDFNLAGKNQTEVEIDDKNTVMMCDSILADPNYMQDKGIRWKLYNRKAEALGFEGFGELIPKPAEADILSPQETIDAIMSGDVNVLPNPTINPQPYDFAIKAFMRSENFKMADDTAKKIFTRYLYILDIIRQSQVQSFNDFNMIEGIKGHLANNPNVPGMPPQGGEMPPVPVNAGGNGNGGMPQ